VVLVAAATAVVAAVVVIIIIRRIRTKIIINSIFSNIILLSF